MESWKANGTFGNLYEIILIQGDKEDLTSADKSAAKGSRSLRPDGRDDHLRLSEGRQEKFLEQPLSLFVSLRMEVRLSYDFDHDRWLLEATKAWIWAKATITNRGSLDRRVVPGVQTSPPTHTLPGNRNRPGPLIASNPPPHPSRAARCSCARLHRGSDISHNRSREEWAGRKCQSGDFQGSLWPRPQRAA